MGPTDHSVVLIRLPLIASASLVAALIVGGCGAGSDPDDVTLPEDWSFNFAGETGTADDLDSAAPPSALAAPPQPAVSPAPAAALESTVVPSTEATPAPAPEPASSAELARRWWQWAAIEPWDTSPLSDSDGSDCGRNQPADVWFLAPSIGSEADRKCALPADRELFVPVLARWCDPDDECEFTAAKGAAVLDGETLDLEAVSNSSVYELVGSQDNPVTPSAEPMSVTDTGWWVRIAALDPGQHELVVYGTSLELETAVRYELTVG